MNQITFAKTISLIAIGAFVLSSCSTKFRVWVGDESQKIYNLKYGEHKKQKMDVFLPSYEQDIHPTVVLVHGGGWKYGKKEHMIHIQKMLFENNIPSININYRLVSKNITYKNQLEDIDLAIEAFNSLCEKAELSPNNYIILGESAGGHLALLYGYKNPERIKKIISLSGPTDFYTQDYLGSLHSRYSASTIGKMVGVKFRRNDIDKEFIKASPISNVSNVPTLLFQGDQDILVNHKQGLSLGKVLQDNNIPHQLIYMKKTGHVPRFFNHKKRDTIIYPKILEWIKK
ncbi:prolyl oligopeptidase family serine peptidase [Chryseobacterium sp.]|uniref:prolyl oligopeptidase family serine peptidase n=1 Tax=Chryseobacterium sp. TaxID=1871047 RepID=UPI00388D62F2